MMEDRSRVEEFTVDGKNFMYIDFSNIRVNEDLIKAISIIEPAIAKYRENSLYTVTNIENVRFDTESKKLFAEYMKNNRPYVKHGAVTGFDGIQKIFANKALELSGRKNMIFAYTKEKAIELLLQTEE